MTQLQEQVGRLEENVQALRRSGAFSGLPYAASKKTQPDEDEVALLQTIVSAKLTTWRKACALWEVGAAGGEPARESDARYQLYLALARLAWAEQKDTIAVGYLRQAAATTERMISDAKDAYEKNTVTLDWLLWAQAIRAETELTLLRFGVAPSPPQAKRTTHEVTANGRMPPQYPTPPYPENPATK